MKYLGTNCWRIRWAISNHRLCQSIACLDVSNTLSLDIDMRLSPFNHIQELQGWPSFWRESRDLQIIEDVATHRYDAKISIDNCIDLWAVQQQAQQCSVRHTDSTTCHSNNNYNRSPGEWGSQNIAGGDVFATVANWDRVRESSVWTSCVSVLAVWSRHEIMHS